MSVAAPSSSPETATYPTQDEVMKTEKNAEKKKMTKEERLIANAAKGPKIAPLLDPLDGSEPAILQGGILNHASIQKLTDVEHSQEDLDKMFSPVREQMLEEVIKEKTEEGNPMNFIRGEHTKIEKNLISFLSQHAPTAKLHIVPSNYYDYDLETRRRTLGAASTDHLCKTIIFENTGHTGEEGNVRNSRYYCVVVQYSQAKINCERIKDIIKTINYKEKLGNRKLNFNFASEELSSKLSGYTRNAITPFCMDTDIPVILERRITELNPPMLWLGGGEIDSKIGITLKDFIKITNCFVGDVLHTRKNEDEDNTGE
eukprot:GDKJ01021934.1.p2 GENE.GDKJ01021934.1~~GDKJ01021934.1.p2  ORF type:complete len:315 (+),score=68.87 GDKJ01021934.1:22-966(+)